MSYDQQQPQTKSYSAGSAIDAGLQAHMRNVYNIMGGGLVVTGVVAFAVANIEPLFNLVFGTPLIWVAMLAPLGFIFFGFTPRRMAQWDAAKIRTMFIVFSAVMGLSMAAIFLAFTKESIASTFFVTAATFAATSIYGYTAKKDLGSMGSFMFMGLVGIFLAMIVNMFMHSAALGFVISILGVVIFTGLTAWETQRMKEAYAYGQGMHEANNKLAVMGALSLYLNFINLFQFLLHFMGQRD